MNSTERLVGKFVLVKLWQGVIGEYKELIDAQKAAIAHANDCCCETPTKWKFSQQRNSWANADYVISFEQ